MSFKKGIFLVILLAIILIAGWVQASSSEDGGIPKRAKRDAQPQPLKHTISPSNFGCIERNSLREAARLVAHDLQHLIDGFNKAHKKFGEVVSYCSMALAGYIRVSLETCANFAAPDDVDCAILKEWYVIQSIKLSNARTNIFMAITDAMTQLATLAGTVQCSTVCDTCVQLGASDRNLQDPQQDSAFCVLSFKEAAHLIELIEQHFEEFKSKTPLFHQVLTEMTLAISDMNMVSSKNLIQKVGEKNPDCPCQADFTLVTTFASAANGSLTWVEDQMNRLCDHAAMQKMDFAMFVKLLKEMEKSASDGGAYYYGGHH